jgi:membrane protein
MRHKEELTRQLKEGWRLISDVLDEYSRDRGELLAGALAFYALLSITPLVILSVALAGFVLGHGAARAEVDRLTREMMGPGAAEAVLGWVDEAQRSGALASLVGVLLLLLTASRLVNHLRGALNQIWNIDVFLAEGFKATVADYIKRRLFAFAVVLAAGPVLLLVFASRTLLTGLHEALFAGTPLSGAIVQTVQVSFSIGLVWVISAVVYKFVPDTTISWRSAWMGGLLTSLLFNLGNVVVGLYLGRASVAAAYGAAGSAVVLLLWVYFSAQMFLIGAEFTQLYAERFGRGLNPNEQRELSRARDAGRKKAEEQRASKRDDNDANRTEALGAPG